MTEPTEAADWLDDAPSGPASVRRHAPPLWAWFLVQGGIVLCWAVFEVISPLRGPRGWLLGGGAFSVMILVAGAVQLLQGILLHDLGRGRAALIASSACSLGFAVPQLLVVRFGTADELFRLIIVYLVVEGALFLTGFAVTPALRTWGMLMGIVVVVGVVLLLVIYITVSPTNWDLLDLSFGFMGLVYAIAIGAGALQVRHAMLVGPRG